MPDDLVFGSWDNPNTEIRFDNGDGELKPLGQIGYEAYYASCDGQAITGALLPPWQNVPDHIKTHWHMCANQVARIAVQVYQQETGETSG
jgi:hypothetical protein